MNLWLLLLLVGSLSYFFTGFLRRYALANNLVDVPNDRGSHTVITPRGGGVAIVITFLAGLLILWQMKLFGIDVFVAFFGAGLLVTIIGFIDDHDHISVRWRLLFHFLAAGWLLFWLSGLPPLLLFENVFDLGWAGHLLALIALVWLLNLYNFMDGIDGLAGVEALSSTLVIGLLMMAVVDHKGLAFISLLMFAAVAGFLVWNFPIAKIFMGDAGSGFLGLMLGAFALYSAHIAPQMLWSWLILLGVFIVDASYTLIHRLIRGDKIYTSHCSHAYQYASRKHGNHWSVTLAVLVINLCWLTPWSVAVAYGVIDGAVALLCAYMPLMWLVRHYQSGK